MWRLVAEEISHSYTKGVPILSELSFAIEADGSSVAIVAPSGSGKTTLLSILGGLMRPTAGSVSACRGDIRFDPQQHVSWVFQTTNMLHRRTSRDNAIVGALARGEDLGASLERADALLEAVGLQHVADKPARFLSGGETQRLSVARAVTSATPFVLADEPTGQLDTRSSDQVADVLFDATTTFSRGLVLVTHDLTLAQRCDQTLTLVDGGLR